MAAQAVETLGGLPDGMTAGVAEERFDQLMNALPSGTFSSGDRAELREKFFQRALPTNASARVTQLVEVRMREFETQTNLNGTPKSSEDAAIDMLAPTRDGSTDIYGLVEDQIISEMGLDPTNENHAFALAQIREQLDRSRSSAVRSQAARLRGQADRMTLLSGTIVSTEDANAGFKATSFGSGRWGSEEAGLMHDALTGAGLDPTALGIVEGSPVDFNAIHDSPEGEQVVDLVVQQFTEVWNHNGQAPTPAAMKTRIEGLLQAGGDGNLRAVTALMGKLSPGHKRNLHDKMGRVNRGRLIALEHSAVFGLDDDQVERLMSLPPEKVDAAARRVSILASNDPDYIEQSKRNGMQIIEAISEENFETVQDAQHFLVNNPMAEFFFQQLEITAQAYAENERGVSVANEDDYRAASLAVYEDLRSRGAEIMTFLNEAGNPVDQLVADPLGHIPAGFEVGFLWSETDRNADPESPEVKSLMTAVGLTRETLPGSPSEPTFSRLAKAMRLQELTDDSTAGMLTDEEAKERTEGVTKGGDVIWRPMTPSNPRFRLAMQSENGGIPMLPFMIRRQPDGTNKMEPLVRATDFDNWPFLASNRRVTGLRERNLFTEANAQNFLRSSINKFIPDFMRNAEEPEWASGLRDRADALRNDINESITRPAQEAAERLRIILTTDEDDVN